MTKPGKAKAPVVLTMATHRIVAERHQWIVQRRGKARDNTAEAWRNVGYCGTRLGLMHVLTVLEGLELKPYEAVRLEQIPPLAGCGPVKKYEFS
jgi:hypothetical protein